MAQTTFRHLELEGGSGITLTLSHVIFRLSSRMELETVYASEVELGDTLLQ